MENTRVALNVYYNRDESLAFLRDILRPLALSWQQRELITHLFYRRSLGRGEHFKVFLNLKSATPETAALMEHELAAAVHGHPSVPPDPARTGALLFMPFANNSVRTASYDPNLGLGEHSALAGPLEMLAACGCSQMLRHATEDLFWPGVAITLADAVFEGFGMEAGIRIAALNSFLQMFVPSSCTAGKSREEAFDQAKLLLQSIRRDYGAREDDYTSWLSSDGRIRLQAWTSELKMLCGGIGAALHANSHNSDPLKAQQILQHLLVMIFLGLADCLLLEESDALATAYRLQRIYQAANARVAV
jgi:hypothetical protein